MAFRNEAGDERPAGRCWRHQSKRRTDASSGLTTMASASPFGEFAERFADERASIACKNAVIVH
jgi:hypothetical protein